MATRNLSASPHRSAGRGGRAFGPGPRVLRGGALIATVGAVAAAAGIVAVEGSSRASRPGQPELTLSSGPVDYAKHAVRTSGRGYGYVPAWLGRQTVPVGRIVTATQRRPWLAVQGDTVRVELPRARVLATVVGPAVPEQGHFPVPRSTRCTFTVTLAHASSPLAISPAQFSAIDEQGRLHRLRVTGASNGRPTSEIRPGETLKLTMTAVLPVGQGDIQWAPVAGKRPVVRWDFDVEID